MVKRLRRSPLTAESGVRFPLRLPQQICGVSVLRFFITYQPRRIEPLKTGLPKIIRFLGRGANKRMGTSLSKLCMSDVCDDDTLEATNGENGIFARFPFFLLENHHTIRWFSKTTKN